LAAAQASDEPLVSERTRDVLTLAVGLLLLGLVLAVLNPDVPILLAGLATIAAAGVPGGEQLAGVVFLLAGAQVGLAGPILWFVVRPAAAARGLGRAREWLARHERPVDLGVLSVFGALFTLKGVAGL
jgi:hypothetical protein